MTKLDGRQLIEQGYQIIIGEDSCLMTPRGTPLKKYDRITEQGSRRFAGELASAIADVLQSDLENEIQADRQTKREAMAAGMKRKTRKRTQTRKRTGPANDRLDLKGREFVTPVKKF